ncbi:MAG: hypothetical protein ACM3QW_02345 [Ignavibacteriales bacterium]
MKKILSRIILSLVLLFVFCLPAIAADNKLPPVQFSKAQSDPVTVSTDKEKNNAVVNRLPAISISSNPQYFTQVYAASVPTGWTTWGEFPDYNSDHTYANYYRFTRMLRSNTTYNGRRLWAFETQANVLGSYQYVNGARTGKRSGIYQFRWRIDQTKCDSGKPYIISWAPKGTTTSEGQTIQATLSPSWGGVQLGSVGTNFTTWKDQISAFAGADQSTGMPYFDEQWTRNVTLLQKPVLPDNVVYLNGTVIFSVPAAGNSSWTWNSTWSYRYWY